MYNPIISAAFSSKCGSLLAMYRSRRCGFSRACRQIRCTVDLLSPSASAILRQVQCVLPSGGLCIVLRSTRAWTEGVALRGSLPLYLGSKPVTPSCSKRRFQRAIVGREVRNSASIWLQLLPSANASIRRARKTSPAGNVRDCAQRVSSSRCSSVSLSTR